VQSVLRAGPNALDGYARYQDSLQAHTSRNSRISREFLMYEAPPCVHKKIHERGRGVYPLDATLPHRTGSERYSPNVVEWGFSEVRQTL
jgi:hypothetical protein